MSFRELRPQWGCLIFLAICVYLKSAEGAAVMSVDLGNEWMKVGVVSPGVPMEIALNKESKRKTPAVLAYRENIRTFGEDAQSVGVKFPSKAYGYLFDLLGKTVDNPIVELYRKRFPYYEIIGDSERNTVVFKDDDRLFKIEELIAQILQKAREFAEDATQQTINECVLIVPGYFGQAERSALFASAELANLKVLQLMNDYAAVALNYGVFHGAEINETAQYFIFYDMGAQKTSAAVVSYQLVKDKPTREINPVIQVLGVGYDRTLGGLDIQLRLRDYLATEFNAMKVTPTDVFTNPRAMAKLFKEAGRLKNVLSANNDHYAQIENLIEDNDFKLQVTREVLEEMCKDMWPRVVHPLRNALKAAGLSLDVISQVILFGGGTRVPKIQEILREEIKQELGKSLNADEAAVMGAVYRAADLAVGFKVKKFIVKDAVLFPVQIVFERDGGEGVGMKQVKRLLFGHMNSYPQKKVITFNKHVKNFDFDANYADLDYLGETEKKNIGSMNLTTIHVQQVAEVLKKHRGENVDSKGIKAHFGLDDSGMFGLTGIEFVFEKLKEDDEDASTLSKLGSTISKMFTGDKTKEEDKTKETGKEEEQKAGDEGEKVNKTEETTSETTETNETNQTKTDEKTPEVGADAKVKNDTVKTVLVKAPVDYKITFKYAEPLTGESYDESYVKLTDIDRIERERTRRETAFNDLETHVIETNDKLNQEEFANCATENEKKLILEACALVQEWLYNGGEDADAAELEKRFAALRKQTNSVYARYWEHEERPEALKALASMTNHAIRFLETAKNLTKDTNPSKDVYSDVELEMLDVTIKETKEWQAAQTKLQSKRNRNDFIQLTVKEITDKMALLDREVKYLVNKLKIWRPKTTQAPVTKKEKKTDGGADGGGKVDETTTEANETEPNETEPINILNSDSPFKELPLSDDVEDIIVDLDAEEDEELPKPIKKPTKSKKSSTKPKKKGIDILHGEL